MSQLPSPPPAAWAYIRVELEDSIWIGPGRLAQSNAERVRKASSSSGLDWRSLAMMREILHLKGADQVACLI